MESEKPKVKKTKKADLFVESVQAMDGTKAADFHAMPEPPKETPYPEIEDMAKRLNLEDMHLYGLKKEIERFKPKFLERVERFVWNYPQHKHLLNFAWVNSTEIVDHDKVKQEFKRLYPDQDFPVILEPKADIEKAMDMIKAKGVPEGALKKTKQGYTTHNKEKGESD